MQKAKIAYTIKHRKAFRRVEKKLLGHNTLRGSSLLIALFCLES